VAGSHRPVGVFLAKGPGLRRGASAGELSILDVAPTLLHGLGLPVPEDLEGRVPAEAFEAAAWKSVRRGQAAGVVASATEPPPAGALVPAPSFGQAEEEAVMKRLQELGYIE
jgi:hypothetical protein